MFNLNEEGTAITEVWKDKTLDCHHGGVVLIDGYISGSNWQDRSRKELKCLMRKD